MKEHRVRTRVTTPSSITNREHADADQDADGGDSLWGCGMQLLRLELQLGPGAGAGAGSECRDFTHLLGLENVKAAPLHQPHAETPAPAPGLGPSAGRKERCSPCSSCFLRRSRRGGSPTRRINSASQRRLSVQEAVGRPEQEQEPGAHPLLRLLAGDLDNQWEDVLASVELLLDTSAPAPGAGAGSWLRARDAGGHTPLLLGGRRLLAAGRWQDAANLASLLLAAGADPNAVNREGRSLLSYAVAALDDGLDTTRLLLNYGASVWSRGDAVENEMTDAGGDKLTPVDEDLPSPSSDVSDVMRRFNPSCPSRADSQAPSVFTYFLRAVIRRRRLDDGCMRTLSLLSQEMSERPRLMHSLVLRTMFRHSRCYRVLGPVFLHIKTAMARYWSGPQELRALCRRAIRRALGVRLHSSARALGLPAPLAEYLLVNS